MSLPQVAFYSIHEIAVRWGCPVVDVAGWAAQGKLQVVVGIEPVQCGDDLHGGLVEVSMAELMPLFRRSGASEDSCRLMRILPPDSAHWLRVTDPAEGILVRATDLMFPAAVVHAFEDECDLLRRPASGGGSSTRYRWDAMIVWLFQRLNERGFPASQTALVAEVEDWFVAHAKSDEVPEESTIRKRIAPIWRAVRGSD